MTSSFDVDPLGAVLEFALLHKAHPPAPQQRSAWEAANLKRRSGSFGMPQQPWIGPAITKSLVEDVLAEGRDRAKVRRILDRVFREMENHYLLDAYAGDDNPATRYRVVTPLGEELVTGDAHREYVHGLRYVVERWSDSVVCLVAKGGLGTGFFVSPRRIATARHVLDENGLPVVRRRDGTAVREKILDIRPKDDDDSTLDVAIIELASDCPGVLPMRFAGDRALLDEVVVFGFPPLLSVKTPHLHVNRGEISSEPITEDGQQVILVTCLLRGGYSGGPALNRRGEVVGLVSKNLYNRLAPGDRDINEGLGAAALIPYEWIQDRLDGKVC